MQREEKYDKDVGGTASGFSCSSRSEGAFLFHLLHFYQYITKLNSEKENPEKIRILKSETQDSKGVSLSMLPSLDVPKPKGDAILLGTLPDVPELRNQTSLENPNYLGTEEPGFFSAELNPLESKFRSSVKLLVMGDDYIYYSVSKKYLKSLISDYMQKI